MSFAPGIKEGTVRFNSKKKKEVWCLVSFLIKRENK